MSTNEKKVNPSDKPDGEFFFDALRDINNGDMLSQLDKGLAAVVSRVLETGDKGKLTLSLSVAKIGSERQVRIKPSIKIDTPNNLITERVLFATETGKLQKDDPRQGKLDFDAPMKVQNPQPTTVNP